MNTPRTASGLSNRTRRRAALIAAVTLPLSLMSAPAIAQTPTPPPTTSPPSTPATPTGKALAQAKKENRRVEVESMRSESTTFYANPDGKTVRMELSTQPIRKRNADGKGFTPIDTTLVKADGSIKPKAALGDLVLSAGRDKTLLKSRAAEAEAAADGATAKITTPSTLPEPQLKGNTATYPGAYGKGRDLMVTADATGFRQRITIAERPAGQVSFQVLMDLPEGLSFRKNAAGRPVIVGKDGKTLTEIRPTLLQDAKADAGAPLDAGKIGKAAVTLADDGKTLVFTPDAAFLADPATTYPVTLTAAASDWWEGHTGQWRLDGGAMDTWINDYDYKDSWDTFTQTQIVVGKSYASDIAKRWRGYLKFPDIPAEFAGSEVDNADLHLWNYQSNECGLSVGTGITARQITSTWDETTLHWNSQPSVTSTGADTEYGGRLRRRLHRLHGLCLEPDPHAQQDRPVVDRRCHQLRYSAHRRQRVRAAQLAALHLRGRRRLHDHAAGGLQVPAAPAHPHRGLPDPRTPGHRGLLLHLTGSDHELPLLRGGPRQVDLRARSRRPGLDQRRARRSDRGTA
ncbi:DNRLRE domain-containing protein [Nonomuraea sp. NPDC004186]